MSARKSTRTLISLLLFFNFAIVIFGTGVMLTLSLTDGVAFMATGLIVSALAALGGGAWLAWHYAPRLRQRYWDRHDEPAKAIWD